MSLRRGVVREVVRPIPLHVEPPVAPTAPIDVLAPSTVRDARALRDRISAHSADVRQAAEEGTRALVRRIVAACRTAPRGSRPGWVHDLETDLLAEKSVTVERVVRLILVSVDAGADVTDALYAFEDLVLTGDGDLPALHGAILEESDAEHDANIPELRAMQWRDLSEVDPAACDELLTKLHRHRDRIDLAIRAAVRVQRLARQRARGSEGLC